mgnify:CR=1 FL=1
MQIIEQMLTGQLPMSEFTQALQKDQALRDTIRHFVPQEAKKDPHIRSGIELHTLYWSNTILIT